MHFFRFLGLLSLWFRGHDGQGARNGSLLVLQSVEAVINNVVEECQSMYQSEYWSGKSENSTQSNLENAATKYF